MAQKKKITVLDIQAKKNENTRFTMVTAYDYPSAQIADEAGIEAILVGDSVAMVVMGLPNTVTITMDEMLHHCRAVSRGAQRPLLVGDMPFMSYATVDAAVHNAGRFLKEADMDVVKLEGGARVAPIIKAIVEAGIAVMGHIGLTPQTMAQLGGYRVQGKTTTAIQQLIDDALALQAAGCFAIVLEAMPNRVAQLITEKLTIPTIGVGAGPFCTGQVLVLHDIIGLYDQFRPKFAKQYTNLRAPMLQALTQYKNEVEAGEFPGPEYSFTVADEVLEKLYG